MRAALFALIFFSAACRANYRDWQTPDCRITKPQLTILQASDTHVRHAEDAAWSARMLSAAIARYKPDAIVITGDVTNTGETAQWLALSAGLKEIHPRPLLVWGNHDMPLKKTEFAREGLTRFYDFRDYRLVLIDTAWDGPFVGSYTSVPKSEFPRLAEAAKTEKKILLFAHHPLGKGAPHFRLDNADAVLEVFARAKLIGAFTGHFHGAYLAPEGNILFAGTAPLSTHQRNHTVSQTKGFRVIELEGECLRSQHVPAE